MKKLAILALLCAQMCFAQKVVLTWTEPATTLTYGFNVYRVLQQGSVCPPLGTTINGSGWTLLQGSINASMPTWNDAAITPGNTYCYAVTAYNTATVAESGFSNVIAVAVPLATGGGGTNPPPNNTPPVPGGLSGTYSPN